MPAFHFTAVAKNGKEQKGVIEAENAKHARQLLRDKALLPLHIEASSAKPSSFFKFKFQKATRLSSKELALLTRQLATLLTAALPVEEALLAVSEQNEKAHIKALLLSVRSKVVEGHALAQALKLHPQAFSHLFCATVAAGEKTGHLDKVLLRLAAYTEQQWHLRQKLKTALIYPSMIVLVAVGIVGFLLEYVVPKMVGVYAHLKQGLPLLTTVLIAISNGMAKFGWYILIVLIFSIFLWRRALKRNEHLAIRWQHFLLRLPLAGYALKTTDTARFARTLSILSSAGVPVLEAMRISTQLITVIPIRQALEHAVMQVREGGAIALALKQTAYFTPMSVHMVASGESSGQLEDMLGRVADQQEEDIVRLIDVGLALFEPLIILVMGVVVLFIVLAVLLPIFQLNQFGG